jgi:hypothetical protein
MLLMGLNILVVYVVLQYIAILLQTSDMLQFILLTGLEVAIYVANRSSSPIKLQFISPDDAHGACKETLHFPHCSILLD